MCSDTNCSFATESKIISPPIPISQRARSTLDTSLLLGINSLCANRFALINCTRDVLFKDLITLLPPHQRAAEQKSTELVLMALTRARFCELISRRVPCNCDLFLMGLLSVMDAILEVKMDILLEQLPVERDIKGVLLGEKSKLRPLYQLMLAHESGEWQQASDLARELKLQDEQVASTWFQSLQWAQEATGTA